MNAAMTALPAPLERKLAALDGAPADAAEAAITLFPFGYRALLEAYDLITTTGDGPQTRVSLTPLGLAVIAACAQGERL